MEFILQLTKFVWINHKNEFLKKYQFQVNKLSHLIDTFNLALQNLIKIKIKYRIIIKQIYVCICVYVHVCVH